MPPRASRYVALLRGINNIGKARRVSMGDLRALFEQLGFHDVHTVLNSGNVVFSAAGEKRGDILSRIEKAIESRLGLKARVLLLSAGEIRATVRENPLSRLATHPSHLLVVVPRVRSDLRRLRPLLKQRWAPEALALGRRVAYVWCGGGVAKSPLWYAVDRALERSGTARNIGTFTRLMALVDALDRE